MRKRATLHPADLLAAVDRSRKEPGAEETSCDQVDRLHSDEIEKAIVDAGVRRDSRVVAVLVRVGDRDKEGIDRLALGAGNNEAALGLAAEECREGGARIGGKAAAGEGVEAPCHLGIEAESHCVH